MNTQKKNILIVATIILIVALVFFVLSINNTTEDQSITKISQLINKDIDTNSIEIETVSFDDNQLSIVNQIKNSEDLINFINSNISINPQIDMITQQPSELLNSKEGNKSDVATFIRNILDRQGLYSSTIVYSYIENDQENIDIIVPFRDVDEPKYIYFEDNKAHMTHHGWSYTEMFEAEEKRKSITIESHCILRQKTGYMEIAECSPQDEVIRNYHFITEE